MEDDCRVGSFAVVNPLPAKITALKHDLFQKLISCETPGYRRATRQ
jgi:hypothetical protein